MNRSDRITEHMKTAFVAVLFVALIAMFVIYIMGLDNISTIRENDVNNFYERLMSAQADGNAALTLNADHLLPEVIGIKKEEMSLAVVGNPDIMGEIYDIFVPQLLSAFQAVSTPENCEYYSGSLAEEKLLSYLESDYYVFFQYHNELPYQVLHAYTGAHNNENQYLTDSGQVVYVSAVLLTASPEHENSSAVLITESGELYVYAEKNDKMVEKISGVIEIYNLNLVAFHFAGLMDTGNIVFAKKAQPIIEYGLTTEIINMSNESGVLFIQSQKDFITFFKMFGYNPDKISSHTEADGASVYVETHGNLRFSLNGIEYSANPDGGISLDHFSAYGSSVKHSVYDILEVLDYIAASVTSVNKHYMGGEGNIGLYNIYRNENNALTVEYAYYYNNIALVDQDGVVLAMTAVIEDEKMTDFRINTVTITGLKENSVNYSALWGLDIPNPEDAIELDALILAYNVDYSGKKVTSEWMGFLK